MLLTIACKKEPVYIAEGKKIASVGEHNLYVTELPEIANIEDSLVIHNTYLEQWIRKHVVINEAEQALNSTMDIERLVMDYRSSLILNNYMEKHIAETLDTAVNAKEIQELYIEAGSNFGLAEDLYRAIWSKVPSNKPKLEKHLRDWQRGKTENILSYAESNSTAYSLDSTWYNVEDLEVELPMNKLKLNKSKLNSMQQFYDDGHEYFVKVLAKKDKGSIPPLNYLENRLRELIIHRRKGESLKKLKSDLYTKAMAANEIKVYK